MFFSEIKPFARYVRYLNLDSTLFFNPVIPVDARLFYVKSGIGRINVDGEDFDLPAGSAIYINAGVPYTYLVSEAKYIAVNFDFTMDARDIHIPVPPVPLEKKDEFRPISKVTFSDIPNLNSHMYFHNARRIGPTLKAAEKEYAEKAPFYIEKLSAYMTEIFVELLRAGENPAPDDERFSAKKITSYISKNLSEDISNKKLAEIFHYHPNYLSSEFCRYFGKPIHKYILEQRIMHAISLLESGNRNINEIAHKSGFSDANYFSRYFKKITGMSPKNYIQNNRTQ